MTAAIWHLEIAEQNEAFLLLQCHILTVTSGWPWCQGRLFHHASGYLLAALLLLLPPASCFGYPVFVSAEVLKGGSRPSGRGWRKAFVLCQGWCWLPLLHSEHRSVPCRVSPASISGMVWLSQVWEKWKWKWGLILLVCDPTQGKQIKHKEEFRILSLSLHFVSFKKYIHTSAGEHSVV